MPYPLSQAPTFLEFRDRLISEFQCKYKQDELVFYFERTIPNAELVQCVVAIDDDGERLLPSQIRSICTRLEIDTGEFGLDLG